MNWDQIEGSVEAWAAVLKEIQDEAAAALQADDADAKQTAKAKANAFIDHSPGLIDGIDQLDILAAGTIIDINNTDIAAALGRIDARSGEITALTKSIKKVTAKANADAKSITLENVTTLIGQLTAVVSQAKKVKKSLDENGLLNPDIADDLANVLEAASGLFPKLHALEDG